MAKNVASLPFVFKHVALMPDVHLGKGALVGSVIATKEAIMLAAIGVDIGCFTGGTLIYIEGRYLSGSSRSQAWYILNAFVFSRQEWLHINSAKERFLRKSWVC